MSININNIGGFNVSATGGIGGVDASKMNIQDLMMAVMAERAMLLDDKVRQQAGQVHAKNQELKQITQFMAQARSAQGSSQNVVDKNTWTVDQNVIKLDNGYTIEIEGNNYAWKIKDADGNEVRIWGDPHVKESDETGHWDFKETATFLLEDGTKITVNTQPWGGNAAVTDSLTITRGNQAIVVTGIGENKPEKIDISQPSLDGIAIDANTNDGHIFRELNGVDDWSYEGTEIASKEWSQRDVYSQQAIQHEEQVGDIPSMSDDLKNFLNANKIAFDDPDGDGVLTPQAWDDLLKGLKGMQESLTSSSQLEMAQLQSTMGKYNQSFEMLSNFTSKFFQSLNTITGNIR
jgi:hypothetical protein